MSSRFTALTGRPASEAVYPGEPQQEGLDAPDHLALHHHDQEDDEALQEVEDYQKKIEKFQEDEALQEVEDYQKTTEKFKEIIYE